LIVTSRGFTRPEIVPLRPQDESPLAVLDFELTFPDMRGLTQWAERPPADADSPLIPQYLSGQPLRKVAILAGAGRILQQDAGALWAQAQVQANEPLQLVFYNYYFPGWRATVNGQPAEIRPGGPNGLITLDLPPGTFDVALRFGSTPPRIAGVLLSALGLSGITALFVLDRRRRQGAGTSANLR
jgi:hypothetical protein